MKHVMRVYWLPLLALSIGLMASVFGSAEAQRGTTASTDNTFANEEQRRLYNRAKKDAERAESDLEAMVPGRSWIFGMAIERHLQHLDRLRRDLATFRDSEFAFEESLTSEETFRLQSNIESIHDLMRHLEADVESLETELRQEQPTRWRVAQDVTDMRTEIKRWKKLQRQIATALAIAR